MYSDGPGIMSHMYDVGLCLEMSELDHGGCHRVPCAEKNFMSMTNGVDGVTDG